MMFLEKWSSIYHYFMDKKNNIQYTRYVLTDYSDLYVFNKKVQVGKDQEKAQSEKDSHSKNQGGKKPN